MDIDEFLEQDIPSFLDKELEQPRDVAAIPAPNAFLTRDYEEEFFAALDASNVPKAKRILHDLKATFDEAPSGTPEKGQLRTLLMLLYDKFKDHIDAQHSFKTMDTTLSSLDASKEARLVPPAPPPELRTQQEAPAKTVREETVPPARPAPSKAEARAKQEPPHVDDEAARRAREALAEAELRARSGDLRLAAQRYREARAQALAMRSVPDDLVRTFSQVHAAIRAAPTQSGLDRQLLLQLDRHKLRLDEQLAKDDVRAAMRTYKEMRVVAQQLTHRDVAEATAKKLLRIYKILQKLKGHVDEKTLRRKVP